MQDVLRTAQTSKGITIVHLSLLESHRLGLMHDLLMPASRGVEVPDVALKSAVGDNLPPAMLEELREMPAAGAPVVYIVHHAPQVEAPNVRRAGLGPEQLTNQALLDRMTRGVQLHMGHVSTGPQPLVRKSQKGTVGRTNDPHKDGTLVSGFSITINDQQAPTRFTNWRALLDEARQDPTLGNVLVTCGGKDVRLADFDKVFRGWQDKLATSIVFSTKNPPGEAHMRFEVAYAQHSEDVILQPGDTALWSNRGMIVHSAREGGVICPEGTVSRAAVLNMARPVRA